MLLHWNVHLKQLCTSDHFVVSFCSASFCLQTCSYVHQLSTTCQYNIRKVGNGDLKFWSSAFYTGIVNSHSDILNNIRWLILQICFVSRSEHQTTKFCPLQSASAYISFLLNQLATEKALNGKPTQQWNTSCTINGIFLSHQKLLA